MQASDSIVIIPTYNEKENIENIIRAVFSLEKVFHILVIEDGSPDGTADIVKRLQIEFPERLFMVQRTGKLGLGTAYIEGFKWSIRHNTTIYLKWMPTFRTTRRLAATVCGLCRRGKRCGYRFTLYKRGQCGKLADGTRTDVLLCLQICAHYYRIKDTRHHSGIRMLPPKSTRNHSTQPNTVQRLCIPN